LKRVSSPGATQRGLRRAREVEFSETSPSGKKAVVASVKHCSILAFHVLCSPLTGESFDSIQLREEERKKEMYAMADDRMTGDRGKAVEAALANIEKRFGKGSIMRLGEREVLDIPAISTTSLSLDAAIGVGGVPRGRIVEIYGPESSGKTTLALHIVAEAQKAGGVAAYIDAEHAMDADYAGKLGVDIDQLLISQPDSGEQALEIAEALVRSNGVDVIVIDSVAALVPRAELDGEMGDSLPGLQARLMSQALRKLTAIVAQSNTCFIFINQIREKIGVMFGSPETTTGGRALKFYSTLRLDIRRIGAIKDGDRVAGNRTKVKVAKNKVAPPFRECEFDIMYGEGISREGDLLDLAVVQRVVEKSGAWFSYKGERLGQGRENAKVALRENADILKRIEREVKLKLGIPVREEPEPSSAKAATK
jgi:recombination protein RecA